MDKAALNTRGFIGAKSVKATHSSKQEPQSVFSPQRRSTAKGCAIPSETFRSAWRFSIRIDPVPKQVKHRPSDRRRINFYPAQKRMFEMFQKLRLVPRFCRRAGHAPALVENPGTSIGSCAPKSTAFSGPGSIAKGVQYVLQRRIGVSPAIGLPELHQPFSHSFVSCSVRSNTSSPVTIISQISILPWARTPRRRVQD